MKIRTYGRDILTRATSIATATKRKIEALRTTGKITVIFHNPHV